MKFFTVAILSVISLATRWYQLHEPAAVCWDETHFGKMAGYYINRTMFFDIHPPLGKMMIALAGYVSGYDAKYDFNEGGDLYNTNDRTVNYIGMRLLCSFLGFLVVPFMCLTVHRSTRSATATIITFTFLTFDVGLIALSQYILLDGPLLFFISGSSYFLVKFTNMQKIARRRSNEDRSFTFHWWMALFLCGVFTGAVVAVKWVGLITLSCVGLWTAADLWNIWEKCESAIYDFSKHFFARCITLILLPTSIYTLSFFIHFNVLNLSGPGDGYYSSIFQSTLQGNSLINLTCPTFIADQSVVSIRQNKYAQNGFIHSHNERIPFNVISGHLQQVTVYHFNDENNKWLINKQNNHTKNSSCSLFVEDGDKVQLVHVQTDKYLLTLPKSSPMTKQHQIVFANSSQDNNSWWRIKLINDEQTVDRKFQVIRSRFHLINERYNCYLMTRSKILPKWAKSQIEITCSHHKKNRQNAIWNFHFHSHKLLKSEQQNISHPSFWKKFIEVNSMMATGNSGLKPKPGENYARPWTWPFLLKGQRFHGVLANETRIYLLGTPVIWWANLTSLLLFPLLSMTLHITKSHCKIITSEDQLLPIYFINHACQLCNIGKWFYIFFAMHYFPFYFMSRVLYFHHYFPSFIFSCCVTAITVKIILNFIKYCVQSYISTLPSTDIVNCLLVLFLDFTIYNFISYSPLCYGMNGPLAHDNASTMFGLKLLDSWEI